MAVDEEQNGRPASTEGGSSDGGGSGDGSKTLGLERWVQFTFIGLALVAFYLLDKIVFLVWDFLEEPDPTYVTIVSAVGALALGVGFYKHERTNEFANEVAGELSKVTWPSRKETWSNTTVVVITTFIAAVILFVFDMAWSSITDLIYNV